MFHHPVRLARPRPADAAPTSYAPDSPPFGYDPDDPEPTPPDEYDFERAEAEADNDERLYGGGQ